MIKINTKTLAVVLICTMIATFSLLVIMPFGASADSGEANTPTSGIITLDSPEVTPGVNVTPTVTPIPTPEPRPVFSNPRWESDHISIIVNNNGGPIEVHAYIEDVSNEIIYKIPAGTTNKKIWTNSISADAGQIVNFGFKAYENGTLIDSKETSLTVILNPTSTPLPPETATISGIIVDKETKSPIVGAEVYFTSETFDKQYPVIITDEFGAYRSDSMYPDNYRIMVKKDGYKPMYISTQDKVEGDQTLSDLELEKLSSSVTVQPPTPTPLAPASVLDSWLTLLTSPTLCVGTIASLVGVIVSLTVIIEWLERQKERRKRDMEEYNKKVEEYNRKKQEEENSKGEGGKTP